MKIEDFAKIHYSKAGKRCILAYEIFDVECLEFYFIEANCKPAILSEILGMHYQSIRKLLQDADLWKYVSTKNGKGSGINRKRMIASNRAGYLYSQDPNDYKITGNRSRRNMEHISVIEKELGRKVNSKIEIVHHINGNKTDNRIDNLILVSKKEHGTIHKQLEQLIYPLIGTLILFDKKTKRYYLKLDNPA
jgi:hypothetical protein